MDYCFPGLGGGTVPLSILVITEFFSGALEAILVEEKGPASYPVKCAIQVLAAWGLTRVLIYSDQEPAILALIAAIQALREHETIAYSGPRYDSQSKGRIENMCGIV